MLSEAEFVVPDTVPSGRMPNPNGREGEAVQLDGSPPDSDGAGRVHPSPIVHCSNSWGYWICPGGVARTSIRIRSAVCPAAFDAMIVNAMEFDSTDGLPEITPVSGCMYIPSGKVGFTAQLLGASPTKLGVRGCISSPTSSEIEGTPKSRSSGRSIVRQ